MLITKTSIMSGLTRTRDIPVTKDQLYAWSQGQLIQDVMPDVSSEDREFLMTGITPEEWNALTEEDE